MCDYYYYSLCPVLSRGITNKEEVKSYISLPVINIDQVQQQQKDYLYVIN